MDQDRRRPSWRLSAARRWSCPVCTAFTIPTGVSYLLHKMGYISWGIGALKGAYIVETEAYSDLRNILALWANEVRVLTPRYH